MASVPVEIRATLFDLATKSSRQVYLVGEMHRSDLSVGGGPIVPQPGDPPVIWGGPIDPYPGHGLPERPPIIWGPNDPRPQPPIHLPPDVQPPPDMSPGGEKPPPEGAAGWGYYDGRWGFFPAPGQAQPKG